MIRVRSFLRSLPLEQHILQSHHMNNCGKRSGEGYFILNPTIAFLLQVPKMFCRHERRFTQIYLSSSELT